MVCKVLNKIKNNKKMVFFAGCVLLSAMSIVTLASVAQYGQLGYSGFFGNYRPLVTQVIATLLGVCVALAISRFPISKIMLFRPYIAVVCWGLVLLTFIPGVGYAPGNTGSQSWIHMPFGTSLQPTELAKISFYLTFAAHISKVQDRINSPKALFPLLLHLIAPVVLIHFQGDDGTALVFLAIGIVMLYTAGLNRWMIVASLGTILAALPLAWKYILTKHQQNRILGLFFPDAYADTTMYQQLAGRDAIVAGGMWGKGLFQPNHTFVPLSENDFIFSYFAESVGFFGAVVLVLLSFAVIFRPLVIAKKEKRGANAYLCVGIFTALFVQTLINYGMNLMLLPVSGLTLPFVSAGGTSVLMLYISIGILMSVEQEQQNNRIGVP